MNDRLQTFIDKRKKDAFDTLLRNRDMIERIRAFPLDSLQVSVRPVSLTWNAKTYTLTIRYTTTVVQWYPSRDKLSVREGNLSMRHMHTRPSEVLRCLEVGPMAFRSLR